MHISSTAEVPHRKGNRDYRWRSSQTRICYIHGVDGKAVRMMVNMIFQLEDNCPCNLKDARKFMELDPRDKTEKLEVETPG